MKFQFNFELLNLEFKSIIIFIIFFVILIIITIYNLFVWNLFGIFIILIMNKTKEDVNSNEDNIQRQKQKIILEKTESAVQKQNTALKQLKQQRKKLKSTKKNLKQLSVERKLGDKDLEHIKKNKNVFKKFFLDYCCCCKCCRNCCEDKPKPIAKPPIFTTTTDSEEPDPTDDVIEHTWNQRLQPKTWSQRMDLNLKRLQEEAEETNEVLKKDKKLIPRLNEKTKYETKSLDNSTKIMKDIRN